MILNMVATVLVLVGSLILFGVLSEPSDAKELHMNAFIIVSCCTLILWAIWR